jgi:ParB family chromosome partitioning protein
VRRIEDVLRRRLGTDVRVTLRAKGKGQLHVAFYSNDDLARVLELILGAPFDG